MYQEISTETTTTDEEGNTVTEPLPEGWYNISCKGFTTGEAKLYAKAGTARAEEPFIKLNDDEVPATYALGGKLLMEGDYTRGLRIPPSWQSWKASMKMHHIQSDIPWWI